MSRISKDMYYLNIAKSAALRSTCLKRMYGAVIVNQDRIIATGYNGSPRGCINCCDTGKCERLNVPHNTDYTACKSVHAEMNALIHASYLDMQGATLYLTGFDTDHKLIEEPDCCPICKRMIINSGIEHVVFGGKQIKRVSVLSDWICTKPVVYQTEKVYTEKEIIHEKVIDEIDIVKKEYKKIVDQGYHNFISDSFKKLYYIYEFIMRNANKHNKYFEYIITDVEDRLQYYIDIMLQEYKYENIISQQQLYEMGFNNKLAYAMLVQCCMDIPDFLKRLNHNYTKFIEVKIAVTEYIEDYWKKEVMPNYVKE